MIPYVSLLIIHKKKATLCLGGLCVNLIFGLLEDEPNVEVCSFNGVVVVQI